MKTLVLTCDIPGPELTLGIPTQESALALMEISRAAAAAGVTSLDVFVRGLIGWFSEFYPPQVVDASVRSAMEWYNACAVAI